MELRFEEKELETASREAIRGLQLQKLKRMLEAAWATNPFYREHWQAAGAHPDQISSLEAFTARVPPVRKRDFMRDQEAAPPFGRRHAHALERREAMMVCTTSGTTGQGVEVHAMTASESREAGKVYAYGFRWAGLVPGDSIFITYPITMLGGGRIELRGAEAYGLTAYPVGNYDAARKLELLARFKPDALMSTTSYLGHLAGVCAELPPRPGLKAMMGGGESGGFAWLERLEDQWQAPLFNHFGATQTRVDHMFPCERHIGTRERPAMLHNIDPYFIAEVVDLETGRHVEDGESGEIVVTSLMYTEVPLIRCALGDRAIYRAPGYCSCGRPFGGVQIGSIARLDDMKKVKGINIWPEAVDDALFAFAQVDEYRVVLTSDETEADVATVRIMPGMEMNPAERGHFENALSKRLRERIGIRFDVELVAAGSLPRSEWKARRWVDERVHRQ